MLKNYSVIGLMSGTSLDGLDIAYCNFKNENEKWKFEISKAETIPYNKEWAERLHLLSQQNAFDFVKTHIEYGHLLGRLAKEFILKHKIKIDFVASHGHTVFHQPHLKITSQIGDGAAIASHCDVPVICDFRALDVALGGQGAPLVPIGDKLLFSEYEACLNLGGIANISLSPNPLPKERGEKAEIIAFDICPVNIAANELAAIVGKKYDDGGRIGARGKVNDDLLSKLNSLDFYKQPFPKSLGREWIDENIFPILNNYKLSVEDKLCTFYEHVAIQISTILKSLNQQSAHSHNHSFTNLQPPTGNHQPATLITGGGTYNSHLVDRIREISNQQIVIPDQKIIEFKEALIFAFLGVLRMRNEVNTLRSVTGASINSIGGAIYYGNPFVR
jgi:anhydro-N-acetylmuramic acid kinase